MVAMHDLHQHTRGRGNLRNELGSIGCVICGSVVASRAQYGAAQVKKGGDGGHRGGGGCSRGSGRRRCCTYSASGDGGCARRWSARCAARGRW